MKEILIVLEVVEMRGLKYEAKECRKKVCTEKLQIRDIRHVLVDFIGISFSNMNRPLTDFMNTDDASRYVFLRNKVKDGKRK